MVRYAIVSEKTKKVVNVCEWDGITQWSPPINHFVVKSDEAFIDNIWDEASKTCKTDYSEKKLQG